MNNNLEKMLNKYNIQTYHGCVEPGYFRYQLSWGGPSDEFRIYAEKLSEYNWMIWKIDYWFMDWFDGAKKVLHGEDLKFMKALVQSFFMEVGTLDSVYDEAMKNYEPDEEEEEE